MYTYVQRLGCKKENTATYVHTGGVSNAYLRIRTARARVHGWVGTEKLRHCRVMGRQRNASCSWGGNRMRRVHREATECVVFIMMQRNACEPTGSVGTECVVMLLGGLGRNRRWKRGLAYRTTEEIDLLHLVRGPVDRRGVAYRKMEETDLLRSKWGSC